MQHAHHDARVHGSLAADLAVPQRRERGVVHAVALGTHLHGAYGNELVLRKYTEEDNSWYKYAETGFAEWDNEADEVYNTL